MNFSCPSCHAKYYVADERVVGRTLKMKCRKCPAEIPIQGRPASVVPRLSQGERAAAEQSGPSSISSDRLRLSLPYRRVSALRPPPKDPSVPPEAASSASAPFRVAIAGKSEGPFGWEELRSGLQRGDVTPGSFVWRPGMARWVRLEEVEELSTLLDSIPPPSASPPLSVRPGALIEQDGAGTEGSPPDLLTPEEREARVRAIEEELGFGEFSSKRRSSNPPRSPRTETVSGSRNASSGPPVVLPTAPGPARWLVVLSMLGSLGLGIWMGSWFAGQGSPGVIREVVEVPVERIADNVPPPEAVPESSPEVPAPGSPTQRREATRKVAAQTSESAPTPPTKAEDKPSTGLPGLSDLGGGPRPPESEDEPAADVSHQPLSAAQIKRTISKYQGTVKRSCWQPALEGRTALAPSTARVSVTLQVAADGSVASARGSPDPDGYPGLSSCIVSRVRAFRFPASGGETDVEIPFVFAAQ